MAGPVVVVSISQHQEFKMYAHVALSQGVVKLPRLQVFLVSKLGQGR